MTPACHKPLYKIDDSEVDSRQCRGSRARERTCGDCWCYRWKTRAENSAWKTRERSAHRTAVSSHQSSRVRAASTPVLVFLSRAGSVWTPSRLCPNESIDRRPCTHVCQYVNHDCDEGRRAAHRRLINLQPSRFVSMRNHDDVRDNLAWRGTGGLSTNQ